MNAELLITGLAIGAYPIGSILKMIVTDKGQAMLVEDTKPINTNERMDEMIADIAFCCNLSLEQLKSSTRERSIVVPRQLVFYFLCERFNNFENVPLHVIGEKLNKHHATVIHSRSAIEMAIDAKDALVLSLFNKCRERLISRDENYLLV